MGFSVNLSVTRCLAVPLRRTRISEGLRSFFHLFPTMKKIFTLILLSMITFNAIHAEITWNLSDDGTLTISGTDMPNYSTNNQPWKSQKGAIQKVVIENGVTNIGRYAFYACNNLIAVQLKPLQLFCNPWWTIAPFVDYEMKKNRKKNPHFIIHFFDVSVNKLFYKS